MAQLVFNSVSDLFFFQDEDPDDADGGKRPPQKWVPAGPLKLHRDVKTNVKMGQETKSFVETPDCLFFVHFRNNLTRMTSWQGRKVS
jgi:hypothetical protein